MREHDGHDAEGSRREHATLHPGPKSVKGPRLTFRQAVPDDAKFILSLRTDGTKNQHLSATNSDVTAQRRWIETMSRDQIYFIIEHNAHPVGTVRMYDQQGMSFCWGSWILSDDAPKSSAVESTLMVYKVGMELGFSGSHFDVRKGNEKVWQYHERLGAKRVGETELDYLYEIDCDAIKKIFAKYADRLSAPIIVDF